MAKMYYSEAEAAAKLRVTPAALLNMVRQGKLHAFADGANKMFKVVEVDALPPRDSGESDIQLAPVDMSGSNAAISLTDSEAGITSAGTGDAKADTVITSEGISIFDDEDLEIEPADPMAKTQIAPSLDEHISMEGANAGSGLLDLTRESDDTSLGAEVLDHIDMESGEAPAPSIESVAGSIQPDIAEEVPLMVETAAFGERIDPSAGAFAGMAIVGALLTLLLGAVGIAAMTGRSPTYLETMGTNLPIVAAVAVGLAVVAAVIGTLVSKNLAGRER